MVPESFWEERNNALRKLPLLVQLITETFILLVIFFLWCTSTSHVCHFCMRCILILYISGQYLSFCLPWASLDFMDSFICHFTSRVNKIHGLATCLFWHTPHRTEQEHKHSVFQAVKGTRGVRVRGKNSLMYERLMDWNKPQNHCRRVSWDHYSAQLQ